jgi:hypothetical protein
MANKMINGCPACKEIATGVLTAKNIDDNSARHVTVAEHTHDTSTGSKNTYWLPLSVDKTKMI